MFDQADWIHSRKLHVYLDAADRAAVTLMTQNPVPDAAAVTAGRGRWTSVGWALMVGALPLWLALLGVPFLPLTVAGRGGVATVIIVVAEVAFWGGALLAGPEAVRRLRAWWRRPASDIGSARDPESGIQDPKSGIESPE